MGSAEWVFIWLVTSLLSTGAAVQVVLLRYKRGKAALRRGEGEPPPDEATKFLWWDALANDAKKLIILLVLAAGAIWNARNPVLLPERTDSLSPAGQDAVRSLIQIAEERLTVIALALTLIALIMGAFLVRVIWTWYTFDQYLDEERARQATVRAHSYENGQKSMQPVTAPVTALESMQTEAAIKGAPTTFSPVVSPSDPNGGNGGHGGNGGGSGGGTSPHEAGGQL